MGGCAREISYWSTRMECFCNEYFSPPYEADAPSRSFVDRIKDTLKIPGMHVSPVEVKKTLLAHLDKLIIYVSVVGVSGGRTWDECIPRAWVVLSHAAATLGEREVVAQLDAWVQEQLSWYK